MPGRFEAAEPLNSVTAELSPPFSCEPESRFHVPQQVFVLGPNSGQLRLALGGLAVSVRGKAPAPAIPATVPASSR